VKKAGAQAVAAVVIYEIASLKGRTRISKEVPIISLASE
jgi:hypothetical protein